LEDRMKKLLMGILFTMLFAGVSLAAPISVISYVTPNDIKVNNLEDNQNTIVDAINSADGALIQAGTVSANALTNNANPENRWGRAFNDWVFTGLLPPTSASLSSTTTAGEAFISNSSDQQKFVEKDATANIYTATKWTYLDINYNGTYAYLETSIGTAEPGITADSIRLARVSSSATAVTAVRDDRPLSIQLDNVEDQYREGFIATVVTPAALTINPGVVYNGSTRITKVADISLALGTADDWATGISGRTTSTKGYVVINPSGSVKLTTTAPTLTDTLGNTAGELRYSVISALNWRVLDWFWMNATGSGDIEEQGYSSWTDTMLSGTVIQMVNTQTGIFEAGGSGNVPDDNSIPAVSEVAEWSELQTKITPTSATNKLRIDVVLNVEPNNTDDYCFALFKDSDTPILSCAFKYVTTDNSEVVNFTHYMTAGSTSSITFKVGAGTVGGAGTIDLNSQAGAPVLGGAIASSVTITEIKK